MRVLYITNGFFQSNEANMVQSYNSVAALCQLEAIEEVAFVGHCLQVPTEAALAAEHQLITASQVSRKLKFYPMEMVPRSWPRTLFRLRQLLVKLDYKRYDLIFTRSREALVLLYLMGVRQFKYEAHSLAYPGNFYKCLLYRLSVQRGGMQIVCITRSLEEDFAREFGISRDRLRWIPCAARLPTDSLDGDERPYIGFCGSDYPGKGLAEFVQLARDFPERQFLAVVRASDHSRALLDNPPSNLIIHKNASNSFAYKALATCCIALAPYSASATTSGGWSNARYISPLKIFEYMALGCLVITSRMPAIEEVIQHRRNGLLCTPDNYDELRAALIEAFEAQIDGSYAGMVNCAKADFESKYSYDARARMMIEAFDPPLLDPQPDSSPI